MTAQHRLKLLVDAKATPQPPAVAEYQAEQPDFTPDFRVVRERYHELGEIHLCLLARCSLEAALAYTAGKDGRGLSMKLGSAWGSTQSGVQSLWTRQDASGLARNAAFEAAQRFQAELGYGIAGRGKASLWVPLIKVQATGGGGQEIRMGVRFTSGPDVEAGLEFGQLENVSGGREHAVQLTGMLLW